jgi:asparagine synthase (glutamine-hydrolysing)
MRSDVPVGLSLSGGLDSSSIASTIGTDYPELSVKGFTIYYNGEDQMDERPLVEEVVSKYPSIQPIHYAPSDDEVAEAFEHVLDMHDVPFPYSPAISYYFVIKLARQNGVKVMLDGQGSDEYMGGYSPFKMLIGGQIKRLRLIQALKSLRWWAKMRDLGMRDTSQLAQASLQMAMTDEQGALASDYQQNSLALCYDNRPPFDLKRFGKSRLKEHLYYMIYFAPLDATLHYGDRMSMAHSIENRVPFLDHRLVEFVFALEDEDIMCLGKTKYILRQSLKDVLPKAIAEQRLKLQFRGREIVKWLHGPLKHLTESRFHFDRLPMLDPTKVKHFVERFEKGDTSHAEWLWRLIILNYWAGKQ